MLKIIAAIYLFTFCLYALAQADGWNTKYLTLTHKGTIVYGDVSINEKGMATVLNGKSVDAAAVTFWTAIKARFAEASKAMNKVPPRINAEQIGFIFKDGGEIRMSLVKKKVTWKGYNPDKTSILVFDALALAYSPTTAK